METAPIVDGLKREYGERIAFVSLNAADNGEGQAAFEALNGRGHPLILLFTPRGTEVRRIVGVPQEQDLELGLMGLLQISGS